MVIVLNNQSLFDISIQEYGSVNYVFDLALANGLSITADLEPGTLLELPEVETDSTDIRDYYKANGIHPATGITELIPAETGECNFCKLFE